MNPLDKVLQGQVLQVDESRRLFGQLMAGELTDIQIGGMLMAMKTRGEASSEIAGAAQALRQAATHFPTTEFETADNCGTGGDGSHSINISTAAAVVAASAGLAMVKHGNRSVSSQCGSADVLEALGVNLQCTPQESYRSVCEAGICFLFAPNYHSGIRYAMPARRALGVRTIFNVLGPLVNPAQPTFQLLGVYDPQLGPAMAQVLRQLGCRSALVVHGSGMDELCLDGLNDVWITEDGGVKHEQWHATDFGLTEHPRSSIVGGTPEENTLALKAIFCGTAPPAHREAVAFNAGALLWVANRAPTVKAGIQTALDILSTDRAWQTIRHWAEVSHGTR